MAFALLAVRTTDQRKTSDGCAGYLTHPSEFLLDEWPTWPKSAIMPVDPKPIWSRQQHD
jgi:hypothetical protein